VFLYLQGNAPFFKTAVKFYDSCATRAVSNGHTIDLFACSLDQVGLAEMKICVEKTGGYLVLDDSFTRGVFIGSFKRVFARDQTALLAAQAQAAAAQAAGQAPPSMPDALASDLVMSFNGELSVLTSREFKASRLQRTQAQLVVCLFIRTNRWLLDCLLLTSCPLRSAARSAT
jgi:hypothetical protein